MPGKMVYLMALCVCLTLALLPACHAKISPTYTNFTTITPPPNYYVQAIVQIQSGDLLVSYAPQTSDSVGYMVAVDGQTGNVLSQVSLVSMCVVETGGIDFIVPSNKFQENYRRALLFCSEEGQNYVYDFVINSSNQLLFYGPVIAGNNGYFLPFACVDNSRSDLNRLYIVGFNQSKYEPLGQVYTITLGQSAPLLSTPLLVGEINFNEMSLYFEGEMNVIEEESILLSLGLHGGQVTYDLTSAFLNNENTNSIPIFEPITNFTSGYEVFYTDPLHNSFGLMITGDTSLPGGSEAVNYTIVDLYSGMIGNIFEDQVNFVYSEDSPLLVKPVLGNSSPTNNHCSYLLYHAGGSNAQTVIRQLTFPSQLGVLPSIIDSLTIEGEFPVIALDRTGSSFYVIQLSYDAPPPTTTTIRKYQLFCPQQTETVNLVKY